jgi:hypothetical protein
MRKYITVSELLLSKMISSRIVIEDRTHPELEADVDLSITLNSANTTDTYWSQLCKNSIAWEKSV